jgi:hypothetical protein
VLENSSESLFVWKMSGNGGGKKRFRVWLQPVMYLTVLFMLWFACVAYVWRVQNVKLKEIQEHMAIVEGSGRKLRVHEMRRALFIRTCTPSPGKLDRIEKWARDLQRSQGFAGHSDVVIAVDTSKTTKWAEDIRARLNASSLPFQMYTFTEALMVEQYPEIKKLPLYWSRESYPWLLLPQSLLMWWKTVDPEVKRSYHRVWAIEDDTDYCGNIASLFKKYDERKADFTSRFLKRMDKSWPMFDRVTPPYSAFISPKERYSSREHLQAYSSNFLDYMLDKVELGMHAPGEQFVPSLCLKSLKDSGNCTVEEFEDGDIGHRFAWNKRVSKQEFAAFCIGKGRNKLFHALKW